MNLDPLVLEGSVIRLEPLGLHHVDALYAVGTDPSLWALTLSRVNALADMESYVAQALADQRDGTALPFATVERSTGRVIGSTRYMNISPPIFEWKSARRGSLRRGSARE